jgi:hypothetical protein
LSAGPYQGNEHLTYGPGYEVLMIPENEGLPTGSRRNSGAFKEWHPAALENAQGFLDALDPGWDYRSRCSVEDVRKFLRDGRGSFRLTGYAEWKRIEPWAAGLPGWDLPRFPFGPDHPIYPKYHQ